LVVDCFGPPPRKEDKEKQESKAKPTVSSLKAKIGKRKATFRFSGSGGTGGLSFECKLDKKGFHPCASPKTYKQLKAGQHEFSVRAVDAKGKHSKPAKRAFRIRASQHQ
jgi:hypothetical protein